MYGKTISDRDSCSYRYLDISSLHYKQLPLRGKIHCIESYLRLHENNRFNAAALQELTELCIVAGLYKKAVKYSQRIKPHTFPHISAQQIRIRIHTTKPAEPFLSRPTITVRELVTMVCRGQL